MDDALLVSSREHVEELVTDRDHGSQGQPATAALPEGLDGRTAEQLHDEEGRAVLGHVVIDDDHDTWMLHGVGGTPFTQEARPHVIADAQLRVKHLDRKLCLVPVRGLVDDRHPSGPENAIDAVLAPQHRPYSPLGAGGQLVVSRRHLLRASGGGSVHRIE